MGTMLEAPVIEYPTNGVLPDSEAERTTLGLHAVNEMRAQMGYWKSFAKADPKDVKTNCQNNYNTARDVALALGVDVRGLPKKLRGIANE